MNPYELNLQLFCLPPGKLKNLPRCLEGIHYENGNGVASNGKIMVVQYKCEYPPAYEGATLDHNSRARFTSYVNWQEPLNKALDLMDEPLQIDFIKVAKILDDFKKRKTQFPNLEPGVLKLTNSYYVSVEQFSLLVIAMQAWEANTVFLPELNPESQDGCNSNPLVLCTAHGCAVLCPIIINEKKIESLKKVGLYYEL